MLLLWRISVSFRTTNVISGKVQTQMGTIMDVYPTLASLSGAEIPQSHAVDGQNLKPLLQGNSSAERENVFLMHFPPAIAEAILPFIVKATGK